MTAFRAAVFFDFDDTLVSIRRRDHAAYVECLPSTNVFAPLEFDSFKHRRSKGETISSILQVHHHMLAADAVESIQRRIALLEQPRLLEHDCLIDGALDALSELSAAGAQISIVSARSNLQALIEQCDRLSVTSIVPSHQIFAVRDQLLKHSCVLQSRGVLPGRSAFVGDSPCDVRAGLLLRIRAIAVTSGLTSRTELERAGAHCVIDDISSCVSTILA